MSCSVTVAICILVTVTKAMTLDVPQLEHRNTNLSNSQFRVSTILVETVVDIFFEVEIFKNFFQNC